MAPAGARAPPPRAAVSRALGPAARRHCLKPVLAAAFVASLAYHDKIHRSLEDGIAGLATLAGGGCAYTECFLAAAAILAALLCACLGVFAVWLAEELAHRRVRYALAAAAIACAMYLAVGVSGPLLRGAGIETAGQGVIMLHYLLPAGAAGVIPAYVIGRGPLRYACGAAVVCGATLLAIFL